MYKVGELANKFNLSRSTLLYYDEINLLSPSKRSNANYRLYSDEDLKRLDKICMYRNIGLSLREIKRILDSSNGDNIDLLENKLEELNQEIIQLRKKQYAIIELLKDKQLLDSLRIIKKDTWVKLLFSVGFDEITSQKWHEEFEKNYPEEHQNFLEALGLPPKEIKKIRRESFISDNELGGLNEKNEIMD